MKRLGSILGAGALVLAAVGTASGAVVWATPDDNYASTPSDGSNDAAFWEDRFGLEEGDCHKLTAEELDAVMNEDGSASLGVAYGFVVVKQANSNANGVTYDNTIFEDVAADETVFADSNGDGVYTVADSNGISHIIVCVPSETTTTTTTTSGTATTTTTGSGTATTTTTGSFSGTQAGTTTQEDTDTIGGSGSGQQSSATWLLLAALGVLLGSIIVLAPSRAKTRQ